ncbi:MAG: hypothetical protein IJL41_06400 [Clostridia bacterium]|nr:hypothetical protein [Clostridia bacterium]
MSKKTLRRALITSVVSLVLCFAMLLGATYAWFTDTAASEGNIITSGKLKIDLLVKKPGETSYTSLKDKADTAIFNYTKWEPGYTDLVYAQVKNTGTLALKYTMRIIPTGTVSKLAEVIDVYYKPEEVAITGRDLSGLRKIGTLKDVLDGASGVLLNDNLLPEAVGTATIALHMQEEAGNEYQNLSIGDGFSIQIIATQFTSEIDAFDDQYDASAEFPSEEETSQETIPVNLSVIDDLAGVEVAVINEANKTVLLNPVVKFVSEEENIEESPYKDYIVDFVLSFNKNIHASNLYLGGQYAEYGDTWIGFRASDDPNDMVTEPIHVMQELEKMEFFDSVDYNFVATVVKEFQCGIYVQDETDVTVTLQLIMIDNEDSSNTYEIYSREFPLS